MRLKRRETQRQGSIGVRELGHARVRLDCLNSSPRGCVPTPPGKTLKPGFLSRGGLFDVGEVWVARGVPDDVLRAVTGGEPIPGLSG